MFYLLPIHHLKSTIWSIHVFQVLSPHRWSIAISSIVKNWNVKPKTKKNASNKFWNVWSHWNGRCKEVTNIQYYKFWILICSQVLEMNISWPKNLATWSFGDLWAISIFVQYWSFICHNRTDYMPVVNTVLGAFWHRELNPTHPTPNVPTGGEPLHLSNSS